MKSLIAFLMIVAFAGTTFAAIGGGVELANIDGTARQQVLDQAAQPAVTEKYEYYDITGSHESELRRQMSVSGIKWDDGKTYDALTTWNVKWNYNYACANDGCKAGSFRTSVDITFRYPRWLRPPDASAELIAKWDRYMANLIVHENGHRDMAVQQTADLAVAVSQLPPAPSRAELDRLIETLASERMAKMNADEKQYDVTTIHGATQGAVFP